MSDMQCQAPQRGAHPQHDPLESTMHTVYLAIPSFVVGLPPVIWGPYGLFHTLVFLNFLTAMIVIESELPLEMMMATIMIVMIVVLMRTLITMVSPR